MYPLVSIIIPCYNSGAFLGEALESIKTYGGPHPYEVIIINDGSTDADTITLLRRLESENYIVLHQENRGPGAARNTGVQNSKGEYIFFLDSDNKIKGSYIEQGIAILKLYPDVGVVYSNLCQFGERSKTVLLPGFDIYKLLSNNYIDMCTLVRKQVWEEIGGFDEDRRVMGFEDWEFWIRAYKGNWKFYHIDEVLFEYRVRPNSMLKQARQEERYQEMLQYVHAKHLNLFVENYRELFKQYTYYRKDRQQPFRSFIKFCYRKYFSKHSSQTSEY